MFYNLETDHKVISVLLPSKYKMFQFNLHLQIIRAYKLLLRDFAINYGVVSDSARKFADNVFHFEKRIVNNLPEQRESVILSLKEAQDYAPSVRINSTYLFITQTMARFFVDVIFTHLRNGKCFYCLLIAANRFSFFSYRSSIPSKQHSRN